MFNSRFYFDYASLTPIDRRVLSVMKKYASDTYANPGSWYKEGVAAKKVVDASRKTIADTIHAHADEILFTSGGTESNNLAIVAAVEAAHNSGRAYADIHIVSSSIEHSSVLECLRALALKGVTFDLVTVDSRGIVDLADLKRTLKSTTILVSIMTVNNEIGAVEPLREIAKVIRQARAQFHADAPNTKGQVTNSRTMYPLFHTDAAQAMYVDLNVEQLGVDLLTLDAGKMYGPRGQGCLYIKRGTPIAALVHGGGQEGGLRSGTENISSIAGFATASAIAHARRDAEHERLFGLRAYFISRLRALVPNVRLNGNQVMTPTDTVSPHIVNVSIPGIDNEFFVLQLDAKGFAVSTKSSCLRDQKESYVLTAIGADSLTSVRFSFGRATRKRHIDKLIRTIFSIAHKRR